MATRLKRYLKSFTLIELIIVIAIIAVLGATAFLLLTQWMSKGRDASKISTIRTIKTALDINFTARGEYPLPQDSVEHTGANGTKLYQGYVGANMVAELQKTPIDPTTKKPYVYSFMKLNSGQGYYQIGTTLENTVGYNGYELAKADISTTAKVIGNYEFDPSLPSLIIVGGNETSKGIYDPSNCYVLDGGKNTVDGAQCQPKKDMPLKDYDNGLVGYWDMESLTEDGKLKDISGNGNHGVFSGATLLNKPFLTGGIYGSGLFFNGSGWIDVPNNETLNVTKNATFVIQLNPGIGGKLHAGLLTKIENQSNPITLAYSGYLIDLHHITYKPRFDIGPGGDPFNSVVYGPTTPTGKYTVIINPNPLIVDKTNILIIKHFNQVSTVYLNGIKQVEVDLKIDIAKTNTSLKIGRDTRDNYNYGVSRAFNGIIDEVKIYNRALSESEILQQAKIAGF